MFARGGMVGGVLLTLASTMPGLAEEPIGFRGKTVTLIIGSAPGGGTDSSGRLIAQYLVRYLPGEPGLIIRNMPGAEGITALNYFVTQVPADGLTIAMGSSSLADPLEYRKPVSRFDPRTFQIIGGVGRGGTELIINKEAERRLYDKSAPPLSMGSLVGVPRSGMQMTAWGIGFLGWNARWVVGYRGTAELFLALDRGELDMTASGNVFQFAKLLDSGRFKILAQSGTLVNGAYRPRPDLPDAPVISTLLEGKIANPLQRQAFDYWRGMATIDKWMTLPPNTPAPYVAVYREAFAKLMRNKEFVENGKKISEDFAPMSHEDVESLIQGLGAISPEAIAFTSDMLRGQGLEVDH
jgi:hypothetical protein